jgi:beta-lactamase class A
VNDRLPVGLDPDVASIAHKTGNLDGFVHDAGIVTTPDRRYVIAVLSGPWPSEGQAPPVFAALSAAVYSAVEG